MNRLLARPTHAVHADGRHFNRPARLENRHAREVEALLADGGHDAGDHVLDRGRVDLRARDQGVQHVRQEHVPAGARERPLARLTDANRAPNRLDDECVCHGESFRLRRS
jgi:hypothetical protein